MRPTSSTEMFLERRLISISKYEEISNDKSINMTEMSKGLTSVGKEKFNDAWLK